MQLELNRFYDDGDTTLGVFSINGKAKCFMIEDQAQTKKVRGETRIPNGTFQVSLRHAGRFHQRYAKKFPGMHDGILCVHNSPDWKIIKDGVSFQYVLIHIGNTDDDTAGCLLPNDTATFSTMRGAGSTTAYKKIYPIIRDALKAGEEVTIKITDIEN